MDFRMHHVAISAADMPASIGFYENFGFTLAAHWKQDDGKLEIAHLKLGESFMEIFWFQDWRPAPDTAGDLRLDLPRVGVKHLAFQVDSIHAAKRFVEDRELAQEVEILAGRTGVTYFFIKDPSGILVEFLEDLRGL